MVRQLSGRLGQQVDAGEHRDVVENHRRRRGISHRGVVLQERLGRDARLEEARRAHHDGVHTQGRRTRAGGHVVRTDSRPVPAISHFSRGYSSRAAAISASDSSSSSEAASPLLPKTTRPDKWRRRVVARVAAEGGQIDLVARKGRGHGREDAAQGRRGHGGTISRDEGRRTKDEGRRTKDEGRRTKDEGRRTKDEGRRTKDEGRRTKDEGRRTKDEGNARAITAAAIAERSRR